MPDDAMFLGVAGNVEELFEILRPYCNNYYIGWYGSEESAPAIEIWVSEETKQIIFG